MRKEGVRANDVTYSVLFQSLWHSQEATALMDEAMQRKHGTFARCLTVATVAAASGGSERREEWTLDLHLFSPGAAVAMTLWVLSQLTKRETVGHSPPPARVVFITGWGKSHSSNYQLVGRRRGAVRDAVLALLRICEVPIVQRSTPESPSPRGMGSSPRARSNPGEVEIDMAMMGRWIRGAIECGLVRGWFGLDERFIIDLDDEQIRSVQESSGLRLNGQPG